MNVKCVADTQEFTLPTNNSTVTKVRYFMDETGVHRMVLTYGSTGFQLTGKSLHDLRAFLNDNLG